MSPARRVCVLLAVMAAVQAPLWAELGRGDQALLVEVVDENLEVFDMARFIDGTPLVFLYGSAT